MVMIETLSSISRASIERLHLLKTSICNKVFMTKSRRKAASEMASQTRLVTLLGIPNDSGRLPTKRLKLIKNCWMGRCSSNMVSMDIPSKNMFISTDKQSDGEPTIRKAMIPF